MNDTLMAQLPYYVLSLATLATAIAGGVGALTGARPRWFLLQAAGLLLVFVAVALIAISAGPQPVVSRDALLSPVRWLLLLGGGLWCAWCALYVPYIVKVRRRGDST